MNTKNLMSSSVKPVDHFTRQDFSTGLVELSEKDLQRIVGGCCCCCCCNDKSDDKTIGDYIGQAIDFLIKLF
jgi:bacteriocin-like protein